MGSSGTNIAMFLGIAVAIIMSGAALVSFSMMDSTVSAVASDELQENYRVGAPGVANNEFYIFTQELEADEEALGVPVAVFSLTNIIVHKGDLVTIHFINPAEEPEDKHNFVMQAPYEMNHEVAGGESTVFTFTADTVGTFTYYCTYDLPSMVGTLIVLP